MVCSQKVPKVLAWSYTVKIVGIPYGDFMRVPIIVFIVISPNANGTSP